MCNSCDVAICWGSAVWLICVKRRGEKRKGVCVWSWRHLDERQSLVTVCTGLVWVLNVLSCQLTGVSTTIGILYQFCVKKTTATGFCSVWLIDFLWTSTAWTDGLVFMVLNQILYPKSCLVYKYAFHLLFSDGDNFFISVVYFLCVMDCFLFEKMADPNTLPRGVRIQWSWFCPRICDKIQ